MSGFHDGVSIVWIHRIGFNGRSLDIDGHKTYEDAAFHLLMRGDWKELTERLTQFKNRLDEHLRREAEQLADEGRDALAQPTDKKGI